MPNPDLHASRRTDARRRMLEAATAVQHALRSGGSQLAGLFHAFVEDRRSRSDRSQGQATPRGAAPYGLPPAVQALLDRVARGEFGPAPLPGLDLPLPHGARFLSASHASEAGARPYKLY